jgi:hypothetical protein
VVAMVAKMWLFVEAFFELCRARFFSRRSVREALVVSAVYDPTVGLSGAQQVLCGEVARVVWILGKRVQLGFTCLHRTIAAQRILQRRSIACRVVVAPLSGVDKPFSAHAWLEIAEGKSIGGPIQDVPVFQSNERVFGELAQR